MSLNLAGHPSVKLKLISPTQLIHFNVLARAQNENPTSLSPSLFLSLCSRFVEISQEKRVVDSDDIRVWKVHRISHCHDQSDKSPIMQLISLIIGQLGGEI